MLLQLGLPRIRLLTNNLDKLASLARHGIEIAGRESLLFAANGVNDQYLATKARRFGHLLG
jgi:GTP cyclohydrolase II